MGEREGTGDRGERRSYWGWWRNQGWGLRNQGWGLGWWGHQGWGLGW